MGGLCIRFFTRQNREAAGDDDVAEDFGGENADGHQQFRDRREIGPARSGIEGDQEAVQAPER